MRDERDAHLFFFRTGDFFPIVPFSFALQFLLTNHFFLIQNTLSRDVLKLAT